MSINYLSCWKTRCFALLFQTLVFVLIYIKAKIKLKLTLYVGISSSFQNEETCSKLLKSMECKAM